MKRTNKHNKTRRTAPPNAPPSLTLDQKWKAGAWDAFTIDEQYMIALTIAKDLNLFGKGLCEPATLPDQGKKRFVEMTMQALTWNTYNHVKWEQRLTAEEKKEMAQAFAEMD